MKLIDVHVYYGEWIYPIRKTSVDDLIDRMNLMGIKKSIIMSSLSINYDMVGGNAQINEIIGKYPRLYGYVYVNPNYIDLSLLEVEKYISNKKFVGIKFHPEYTSFPFNSPYNNKLFDYIEKINKPIIVHTWPFAEHGGQSPCGTPKIVTEVARARPNLKIIAGHMGGPAWREMVNLAKGVSNLWVTHISSWGDVDKIAYAIKELGADKVLFGSGMMEGNGISQLGALQDTDLNEDERHKFYYQNAMDLFQLEELD